MPPESTLQQLIRFCLFNTLILTLVATLSSCSKTPGAEVTLKSGTLQGILLNDVNTFLGVPYAKPPLGDLRWKRPYPVEPWQGTLQANEVPPHCSQLMFGLTRGQEDCLYLNVYSPDLKPEQALPVMVWIHGGGFKVGHSWETTPGENLSKFGNVVVVSINYRLGSLGFLAHPELSKESKIANGQNPASAVLTGPWTDGHYTSGNYGMLDQVFSLQWVKDNIEQFGGDPNNVTIFGESAGGMSVCNLLATDLTTDLFHRAIIQSGPCFSPNPGLSFMESEGVRMQQALSCPEEDALACMRHKSVEELSNAIPPDPGMVFGEEAEYWMPNIDGFFFKRQPGVSFETGNFQRVPVMNGNNANEGDLLVMFGHEYQFEELTPELYPERIHYLVRDPMKVEKVMQQYPLENYQDPSAALSAVFGDHSFVCHEKQTSDAISKFVPVYSYYFTYPDADFILPELRDLGAFHSAEVQFVFNESMAWFESTFSGDELTLSQNIQSYWAQFAHTGNPNGTVDYQWPKYNGNKQRLALDLELSIVEASSTDAICDFWDGVANKTFVQ